MALLYWLYAVSFCGLVPLVKTNCTPQPGQCCSKSDPNANDTTVHPSTALSCSFESDLCCYRQGCVDWGMTEWSQTEGYATLSQCLPGAGRQVYSVLESPWVNFSTPACVEFTYNRATPYLLDVFLAYNNGTEPSLMEDSVRAGDKQNITVRLPIRNLTGKIQFRVKGGGAGSISQPLRLFYVRITEGTCNGTPGSSSPSDPSTCEAITTTLPTTQPSVSRTIPHPSSSSTETLSSPRTTTASWALILTSSHEPITSTASVSSSSQPPGTNGVFSVTAPAASPSDADDGDGVNVAAIAGASVSAVAVIAVVVVVVIFVYRRRLRSRKSDGDERSIMGRSTPTGDSGYVNIVAAGSSTQTTVFTADSKSDDPYEVAEDGVPGKTRNSFTDTYNFIPEEHNQPNGTLNDDYSSVDDVQRPAAGSSGKNDAQATQDCKDVYSVVNKAGKKPASPADYSLAKIVDEKPALPNPNDVYSVVNKKGKKPTIAPKPGTLDAEYNTTSHTGRSTTTQGAGDATADTYNRIGAVPSLGSNGQSQESTTDEYNTLDFADARQTASRKEKSGAYDHVSNNPDDSGYSKTRIGERNVVIDSEYHHLQA